MRHRLVINGGRQTREFVLVGTMVVGRDPMCDVSDADPLLSRRHAEFKESAKNVTVRDLGSRNGILVNGVKQAEAVLHAGDVVQIGHLQVKYLEQEPPTTTDLDSVEATVIQPAGKSLTPNDADLTVMTPAAQEPEPLDPPTVMVPLPEHDYVRYSPPGTRISCEIPASGWNAIGGGATTLAVLAHRSNDASIAIERAPRPEGVAGSASALAAAETKIIRDANPTVLKIESTSFDDHLYTASILNYSRQSSRGLERVFQFSCVDGPALYRITCSAIAGRFDEFGPAFSRAAASFDAGGEA